MSNPLVNDRQVDFDLYEVLDVEALSRLPRFADHSRETFDMVIDSCRRLARDHLWPAYREIDVEPPTFDGTSVRVHPTVHRLYRELVDLGLVNVTRPYEVGGQQLPTTVVTAAHAYLKAANASLFSYVGLTTGAAHLIETFGDDDARETFMGPMYAGEWTGTMALTEPHAGSSLGDLSTTATPRDDGTYAIRGSKIFISGGDHDVTDNIVHLTLARIAGAPAGTKGISLFAVPKKRPTSKGLVDNDVSVAGMIHKIGWRGLPSLALNFGENDDCVGWLIGEPNRGLAHMFQMMNSARIMVGLHGVATASVAYQEALAYAKDRPQGRPADTRDPTAPQVPIIEHDDVKRMLLRQKAIVEGGLALVFRTAWYSDLASASDDPERQRTAQTMLDLLTPITKSFPAERGYDSNVLAVQVHGGYGYSSEYLPEAWLRDQKLNSIHEGTTGIQGLDLLGRRVMAGQGATLQVFAAEVANTIKRAVEADVRTQLVEQVRQAVDDVVALTGEVGARGAGGDVARMLRHSTDYLDLFSTLVLGWLHVDRAAAANEAVAAGRGPASLYAGVQAVADYWSATEMTRVPSLVDRIRSAEDSFARMRPDWF
jgi:alkylation response protein AidB-like acyl-CoA dehydrogenase